MLGNDAGSSVVWTLTGRERELQQVAGARTGGASGVVITGGAGVGKTRLLAQAVQDAAADGVFTIRLRGTGSSAQIPLAAFASVIPQDAEMEYGARLLNSVRRAIRDDAGSRETLVAVDDAHLLDNASATMLLYLIDHGGVFAIVTTRAGERTPDAITAIWKDAGAYRIELDALGERELVEMVELALKGPLQRDARRWLIDASARSALYAHQLVESALRSGALIDEEGLWRLGFDPPAPVSLRELTCERIGMLGSREQTALELITLGEPLALSDAGELIGAETITALELSELVAIDPGRGGGSLRLANPLYPELVLERLPASRARAHRLALARRIGGHEPRTPADALLIARWLADAGEAVPVKILIEAANAAQSSGSTLCSRFARMAQEMGAGAEAAMILAAVEVVSGRPAEAEAALAPLEGQIDDPELALRYLQERTTTLQWGLGAGHVALALLGRAESWWEDERWRRAVHALQLQIGTMVEKPGTVSAELRSAITEPDLDTQTHRSLTRALASDRYWTGAAREAEDLLSESWLRTPLGTDAEFLQFASYVTIKLGCGSDLPGLDRQMRAVFEQAIETGDPAAAGLAALAVGVCSYQCGRILDAQRWLNEAEAQSRRQDPFSVRRMTRALQVGAALQRADAAAATAAAERLSVALHDPRPLPRSALGLGARGRAWAQIAAGDRLEAQRTLLAATDAVQWAPELEAEILYEAMRTGVSARQLNDRLAELRESCDAPLTKAYGDHISARATGSAGAMLTASGAFEQLGVNLYAAEAAAHAAAAYASEGRQDSARRAAARSHELQPVDQGAVPLVIDGVDRDATELTPREAQLVELAAQGLSNPEIAERLVLSSRTVETHIYRAMRKLGVSDRRDFKLRPPAAA